MKQIWPNGLANSSTVIFQNFDNQYCNWSTIELPRNGAKHKCKLLKVAKQMQAPRLGERVVQENALEPWDKRWPLMSQLSQQSVFKITKGYPSITEQKFGK